MREQVTNMLAATGFGPGSFPMVAVADWPSSYATRLGPYMHKLAALAMLSDERNRHLFTTAELASIDRILPWTRAVRPGPVTLEDGQRADLLDYAISHQDDLILKPTLRYGGQDVLPGWHHQTSPELWRKQLARALDGSGARVGCCLSTAPDPD